MKKKLFQCLAFALLLSLTSVMGACSLGGPRELTVVPHLSKYGNDGYAFDWVDSEATGYKQGDTYAEYTIPTEAGDPSLPIVSVNLEGGTASNDALTSLIFPASVSDVSLKGITNLRTLRFMKSEGADGYYLTVTDCPELTDIDFGDRELRMRPTITNCPKLKSAILPKHRLYTPAPTPSNLHNETANMFQGCTALEAVDLSKADGGAGTIFYLDESFCDGCTSLKTLVLPNRENYEIRTDFKSADLEIFLYRTESIDGTKGLLKIWDYAPSADRFKAEDIYLYSETKPTSEGKFWHYVEGTVTKW